MHQLLGLVSQLFNQDIVLLVAIFRRQKASLESCLGLLHIKFGLFSSHLELMTGALLNLCQLKLDSITGQSGILQGLRSFSILPTVVLVFQVYLLLQLIDFNLKFDATFTLKIVGFEKL